MKADRVRKWRKMEINTNTREMQVGRDVQSRETKEKARTSKRRQTNLGKSVIGCGGCRALCLERRKGKERKAKSKVNERNERETAIETGVVESFFLTFFLVGREGHVGSKLASTLSFYKELLVSEI